MATKHSLDAFAAQAEDVALRLRVLQSRDPRTTLELSATINALYLLSTALHALGTTISGIRSTTVLTDLEDELGFLRPSLTWTLDDALSKLAHGRERTWATTWIVFTDHLEIEEGFGFLQRLQLYQAFLSAQLDGIDGFPHRGVRDLRRRLAQLKGAQEVGRLRANLQAFDLAGQPLRQNVTRPTQSSPVEARPPMRRPMSTFTPIYTSEDIRYNPSRQPPVPTPPPLSPTYTTTSSHTLSSTDTSYSCADPARPVIPLHWANQIFARDCPESAYLAKFRIQERSSCHGENAPKTLQSLVQDGYTRVVELPFDQRRLYLRLYWRSTDDRARIVIITRNAEGKNELFCTPIQNLKFIRRQNVVQLCRARADGVYILWAKLVFTDHEKMVLFYSTFLAMKHQDRHKMPHRSLLDDKELLSVGDGEEEYFGGQIKQGNLVHALRLFKDRTSGVVRLEASTLSGPKKDVPIWTAFLTKYSDDPDWAHWEGGGRINLAALKPPPFVFLSSFEPLSNKGGYILEFTTTQDAKIFIECWTGLCRSSS